MEKKENGLRQRRAKTVRAYLMEYTAKHAVSEKDTLGLALAARNGDLNALNTLVNAHLSLVKRWPENTKTKVCLSKSFFIQATLASLKQ